MTTKIKQTAQEATNRSQEYKIYIELLLKKAGILSLEHAKDYEKLTVAVGCPEGEDDYININTWKRLYGKLNVGASYAPSGKVKQAIARYLGFKSWDELVAATPLLSQNLGKDILLQGGGFIKNNKTYAMTLSLKRGDSIEVDYGAHQHIEAEFISKNTFRVISSTKSELQRNDTFTAFNFVPGDLFRVANVIRDNVYIGDFTSGLGEYINQEFKIHRLHTVMNLGRCA